MHDVRTKLTVATGCVALFSCVTVETVVDPAGSSDNRSQIIFDAPVPTATGEFPLYELQHFAVSEQERRALRAGDIAGGRGGALRSARQPSDTSATAVAPQGSRNFAFANGLRSNNAGKEALQTPLDKARAVELTNAAIKRVELVPPDDTRLEPLPVRVLKHMRMVRGPQGREKSRETESLAFVPVRRFVGELAVDGPGSRFTAAYDRDADLPLKALVLTRQPATQTRLVSARLSAEQVQDEIRKQILTLHPRGFVHVQSVTLAYYDGGARLLQPVYRFVVELSPDSNSRAKAEHVVGYVRYAETDEEVPMLGNGSADSSTQPAEVATASPRPLTRAGEAAPNGRKVWTVGRYVARNDSKGWVRDANEFWAALEQPGGNDVFRNTQYLFARSTQFLSAKNHHVNGVNIALIEAHGRPWAFATDSDCCDIVDFMPAAAKLAYGQGPDQLKHWVLHSCDAVPSPDDTAEWATPWWKVFHGLNSVEGYRSSMFINDGAGAAFGQLLAAGTPIPAAWLTAVASLNIYAIDPTTMSRCEGAQAMGRPMVLTACNKNKPLVEIGVQSEADLQVAGDAEADCLDAWWFAD